MDLCAASGRTRVKWLVGEVKLAALHLGVDVVSSLEGWGVAGEYEKVRDLILRSESKLSTRASDLKLEERQLCSIIGSGGVENDGLQRWARDE